MKNTVDKQLDKFKVQTREMAESIKQETLARVSTMVDTVEATKQDLITLRQQLQAYKEEAITLQNDYMGSSHYI